MSDPRSWGDLDPAKFEHSMGLDEYLAAIGQQPAASKPAPENVQQGKASRATGEQGEQVIMAALAALGFVMITKVANTWHITKIVQRRQPGERAPGEVLAWVVSARVEGDYRAIDPQTGKSVLCEVKAAPGRLQHSRLKDHQRGALDEHHEAGGISLLAWVDTEYMQWGTYVMRWPIQGFVKYTSLTPDQAREHDIQPTERD